MKQHIDRTLCSIRKRFFVHLGGGRYPAQSHGIPIMTHWVVSAMLPPNLVVTHLRVSFALSFDLVPGSRPTGWHMPNGSVGGMSQFDPFCSGGVQSPRRRMDQKTWQDAVCVGIRLIWGLYGPLLGKPTAEVTPEIPTLFGEWNQFRHLASRIGVI